MYKRFILPLLQAERRIEAYRRDEQWRQLRDISLICIAGFLVMSILNFLQHDYAMLAATLGTAAVLGYCLHDCWRDKITKDLEWAFAVVFTVLCTCCILFGGNDGFAILWVVFVPFLFTLMIDTVKGIILSNYLLLRAYPFTADRAPAEQHPHDRDLHRWQRAT